MEPTNKRPRTEGDGPLPEKQGGQREEIDAAVQKYRQQKLLFLQRIWGHFQAYLASTDQEDPEGTPDVDELHEILEWASCQSTSPVQVPLKGGDNNNDNETVVAFYVQAWRKDPIALLPVLLSVATQFLADHAIALFLEQKNARSLAKDDQDDQETSPILDTTEVTRQLFPSLNWFPTNPSTLSMLANWIRMEEGGLANPVFLGQLYRYAARQAALIRQACLKILDDCPKEDEEEEDEKDAAEEQAKVPQLPVIIEGLVLNQVVGVEYNGSEEDIDDEDDDDNDSRGSDTEWTSSAVEGTARFMAAMQFSMAGCHDEAAKELKYFDFTHRLHPNVWNETNKIVEDGEKASSITIEPALFEGPVLPTDVLEQLRQAFHPDSPYWMESGYNQRGYYSFFVDRLQRGDKPKDLIQDIIESFLLPLVEKQLESNDQPIVGYEWWVHTRPVAANLGHNLHFDTDEALLKSQKQVTHPIVSTVLYLDGMVGKSGPTIVLNQNSAENAPNADKVWRNDPHPNSYLLFPGNMLHGVLPCSTFKDASTTTLSNIPDDSWVPDFQDIFLKKLDRQSFPRERSHRLTFMVGYWTRRVPDQMDDPTELYAPCGPMPPDSHVWIRNLRKGYPNNLMSTNETSAATKEPCRVPHVSPAWEALPVSTTPDSLDVPTALDHRFFVRNPPTCFRESLFE